MKIKIVLGVAVAGIAALGSGWVLLNESLGWWDPSDASTAQEYYLDLIAGIASSLHNEVVIMGLFVVLMTHAGESVLGLHPREKGDFLKILVILLFVILFASYYAVTYALDLEQGSAADATLNGENLQRPFLPILMIPIDLAAIGLSIAIMVSLASERVLAGLVGRDADVTTRSISEKLMVLMSLTASWHLITVLWWVVYCVAGSEDGAWWQAPTEAANDLAFHGLFAGLQVLGVFLVGSMRRTKLAKPLEWLGVGYYCILLGMVYAWRMYVYIDR